MTLQGRIWLITGLMAAGKSSVAQALAERLSPSVHIRGDLFRKMIVNGREEMTSSPSVTALSQLELRYKAAWQAASAYADAGFQVVLQDVVLGRYLQDAAEALARHDLHLIALTPSYEALAARDRHRSKTAYGAGWTPENLGRALLETPRLGLWLDTSLMTVAQTVELILNRIDEARVDPLQGVAARRD